MNSLFSLGQSSSGRWEKEKGEWIFVDSDGSRLSLEQYEEKYESNRDGYQNVLQHDETWDDSEDFYEDEENAPFFNLSDSLAAKNKSIKFRASWKEDYKRPAFDYKENKIEENSVNWSLDWDFSGFFDVLVFIAKIIGYGLILLVIFILIRGLFTDAGFSLNSFKSAKKNYNEVDNQELNIDEDWLSKAYDAKLNGNLKLSIRYYFLAYLKQLHQENHIDFHGDKSNREYRYEIVDTNVKSEFDLLSRVFDYCWYGDFDISSEHFGKVEVIFNQHLKK